MWRKPKRSFANGNCVEVMVIPGWVLVRDSKNPDGLVLRIPIARWPAFVRGCEQPGISWV